MLLGHFTLDTHHKTRRVPLLGRGSASRVIVMAIPVASGRTVTAARSWIPAIRSASPTRWFVILARSEDPAACKVWKCENVAILRRDISLRSGHQGREARYPLRDSDLGYHLRLLCCNVPRPADPMSQMVVAPRHQGTRHASLALPDTNVIREIVAVHEGQVVDQHLD